MTTIPPAFPSLDDEEYRRAYGTSLFKYDVAFAIVEARAKKGLSQKEMAEACGVSQPYIAKLESGDANPTIAQLGSLLASIGMCLSLSVNTLHARPDASVVEFEQTRARQKQEALLKALEETAGILSAEDQPEWATPEKAAAWVRKQRGHTP